MKYPILSFLIFLCSIVNAEKSTLKESSMNATVVQKEEIYLIGIECRTSNAQEAAPHDIPRLWQRFYSEGILNRIPNKISKDVIALYCDYETDHTGPYSLVIGCPVTNKDEIPEGMTLKLIPRGSYSVFPVSGEYPQKLVQTWGEIWATPLPRTYTGDYELYKETFASDVLKSMEVFIAIEKP